MVPGIANFISQQFYSNRFRNGSNTENRGATRTFKEWVKSYAAKHGKTITNPASSFFRSVYDSQVVRRKHSSSPCNPSYIERTHDVVMDLLQFIAKDIGQGVSKTSDLAGKVRHAVACYDTEELSLLKKWFHHIEDLADVVVVVTVDAAQGWEWDIVILSTIRPAQGGGFGFGFVRDPRRMNVSLSRVKYGQVTIGFKGMSYVANACMQNDRQSSDSLVADLISSFLPTSPSGATTLTVQRTEYLPYY